MSDPSHALQRAVYDVLRASAALKSLISDPVRVYDRVPINAAKPYLTFTGDEQTVDDGNSCGDAWECFVNVHVWSDAVGMPQAKQIAGAVRDALANSISVDDFVVVEGLHVTSRFLKDPDPLITHGVITFRYLIDPAD
jgi:hypothetical protein